MYRYLLLVGFGLFAQSTQAATLYLDPPTAILNRGDAVTLAVRLDTDETLSECVNAADVVVTYGEGIVPVDVGVGESIFSMWVETPTIDREKRQITFAGGIPNGYCGRVAGDPRLTNKLAELVFRAPGLTVGGNAVSATTVTFDALSTVYLNDGFGTAATPVVLGAELQLSNVVGTEIVDDWRSEIAADDIPPEPFSISLEEGQGSTFNGQHYIVFTTTDKQSGISHYEVIEESVDEASLFSFGAATAPWAKERSPYILKDQDLRSIIRVRAIDKAGNEYVATLAPQGALKPWWQQELVLVVTAAVVGLVFMPLLVWWWYRRRRVEVVTMSITHHE